MALTRAFKDTVRSRVQSDPAFRAALLTEAFSAFVQGDPATGKAMMRDYINRASRSRFGRRREPFAEGAISASAREG